MLLTVATPYHVCVLQSYSENIVSFIGLFCKRDHSCSLKHSQECYFSMTGSKSWYDCIKYSRIMMWRAYTAFIWTYEPNWVWFVAASVRSECFRMVHRIWFCFGLYSRIMTLQGLARNRDCATQSNFSYHTYTLHHTAPHCNTLQHTAPHCNTHNPTSTPTPLLPAPQGAPVDTRSVLQCGAVCCSVVQCGAEWCSVLQCVAVCCRVVQCVAVCCSVLQSGAVCCRVVQCVAVRCSVVQCGAVWCSVVQCDAVWCSVLQCGAVWCSVVQCDAVWCSVLQCVAVCCSRARSIRIPCALRYVAVCCSELVAHFIISCALQFDAVCRKLFQRVAVCCSLLQRVDAEHEACSFHVRWGVFKCVAVCCCVLQLSSRHSQSFLVCCSLLQSVAVCCSLLQPRSNYTHSMCVALCCSLLLCVAAELEVYSFHGPGVCSVYRWTHMCECVVLHTYTKIFVDIFD